MGQTEPTEDGVRLLLDALKGEVQDIAPVRSNVVFDKALCGQTVWRGRNESMANYVARRRKEVAELKDDPDTIVISEGIQAAFVTFRSEARERWTYVAELVDLKMPQRWQSRCRVAIRFSTRHVKVRAEISPVEDDIRIVPQHPRDSFLDTNFLFITNEHEGML